MNRNEIPLVDAAAILKKTWSQVWQLVLTGAIEGRKVDGKWMVSQQSLRDYKAGKSTTPDAGRIAHSAA